jgi:transcriptional regulator with XRE-family HTH domain
MDNTQVANRIKELCKLKGSSVSKMLEVCNIRKSLIYDLEKRNASPSIEVIRQIADYLNCSVDYLLGRTDSPTVSGNNISNFDTTINGTQANIIQGAETDLDEIKVALSKLTSSNRHRAIADMLDLLEKYIEK